MKFKIKVENMLKDSLDMIPSHSPSAIIIQIIGGKICLKCKGKTLLGVVNKIFVFKSFFVYSEIIKEAKFHCYCSSHLIYLLAENRQGSLVNEDLSKLATFR